MKRQERLALLDQEAQRLEQASAHLHGSLQRCAVLPAPPWSDDQLERHESLGSRFARLADLLTQRLMRLADELELEAPGSLIDRIAVPRSGAGSTRTGNWSGFASCAT